MSDIRVERAPDFSWLRFVVPAGEMVAYGPDRYVVDPLSDEGRLLNARMVPVTDILSTAGLSLLGEPGIGKSTVMRKMYEACPGPKTYRDLSDYASDQCLIADVFESSEFQAWINSTEVLYLFLDGLDVCLAHVRTAAALLAHRLDRYPLSRLRVRIASRSGDWPEILEAAFTKLWPGQYRSFELVPLRRVDVESAAAATGFRARGFMEAVHTRGVEPFTSRPLTLEILLNLFRVRGALPNSPVELYEEGCLSLAAESNLLRRAAKLGGSLTPRERVDVAALMAAVGVVGKASGFATRRIPFSDKNVQDVVDTEVLGATFQSVNLPRSIATDTCEEVLKTALFSWRNDSTAVWAHWTYAEFLAGRFLGSKLTAKQLVSLFMRRGEGGRLWAAPQAREAIAWASSFNPEFRRVLIEEDPLALAQSTVAGLDDEGRCSLVTSLLQAFNRRDAIGVGVDRRPRYELLAHPGLAQQITRYIGDGTATPEARLAAIEIAEKCNVGEAVPELAARALDTTENVRIREAAAWALSLMNHQDAVAHLRPLLRTTPSEDPLDQLRGATMRGLLRAGQIGDDVWEYVTAPRRKSYIGAYAVFLADDLPKKLPELDLHAALRFAREHLGPDNSVDTVIRGLIHEILRLAWVRRTDAGILDALGEIVWRRLSNSDSPLGRGSDAGGVDIGIDQYARRRLLMVVVGHALASGVNAQMIAAATRRLLSVDDFAWAIEQATSSDGVASSLWALLARLTFRASPEAVELLFGAIAKSRAVADEMGDMVRAVVLNSPEAKEQRAHFERITALERRGEGPEEPPFPSIACDLLNRFESGNTNAFWHLNFAMTAGVSPAGRGTRDEFESDLRAYEAWTTLDEVLKTRVREAAYHYLLAGDPSTAEWLGTTTFHRPAAAGYRALALLHHEGDTRLETLSVDVWAKWSGIIVGYPDNHEGVQTALGRRAYRAAPEQFRSVLLRESEREDREVGSLYVLVRFRELMDVPLANTLFKWLQAKQRKPGTVREVLESVLPLVAEAAEWAKAIASDEARLHDVAPAAAEALVAYSSSKYWVVLWQALAQHDEVLVRVLARLFERCRSRQPGGFLPGLTEDQVAELHTWLAKKYPPASDPDYSEGAHSVSDADRLRELRGATLLHLKERGTSRAVEILAMLAASAGPQSRLRYMVFQAEEARLRKSWCGLRAPELASLLTRREARVVDSDDELLLVVVEALERLQSRLVGETPAAEDLWDKDRPKGELALSDYVKRFLAEDLKGRRIVVNREVEVMRGSLTDVRVEAATARERTASVTVEVKGCWHREVTTALQTQLINQYLRESARRCGVYLVVWFVADRWSRVDYRRKDVRSESRENLLRLLKEQAVAATTEGFNVEVVALDATAVVKR